MYLPHSAMRALNRVKVMLFDSWPETHITDGNRQRCSRLDIPLFFCRALLSLPPTQKLTTTGICPHCGSTEVRELVLSPEVRRLEMRRALW